MDERKMSLLYTGLAVVVGVVSGVVPKTLAYVIGVAALFAANGLAKKKIPGFKQHAASLSFLYITLWVAAWTIVLNS